MISEEEQGKQGQGSHAVISIKPTPQTKLRDIEINFPDWTFIRRTGETTITLENPDGYELPVQYVEYQSERFLKVGNSTYLVIRNPQETPPIDLKTVNAIGNYQWFRFFNRKYSQILHNTDFSLPFDDPRPAETLRLYPVNGVLYPCLKPPEIPSIVLSKVRQKLLRIFGRKGLKNMSEDDLKRIKYNFFMLINYVAIIATHGDSQDYYDAQNVLTALKQWANDGVLREITPFDLSKSQIVENSEVIKLILNLKEHILLRRTGANWHKWKMIKNMLVQSLDEDPGTSKRAQRTQTVFERKVGSARLLIPSGLMTKDSRNENIKNWRVVRVEALGRKDLEPLSSKCDVQNASEFDVGIQLTGNQNQNTGKINEYLCLKRRATVFGFGETLVSNAIMVSLAFAGGSATTVKKILGKNKLVHLALKVTTPRDYEKWISLLHARAGMILGQNPHSKIVFVTNVEGYTFGESESSTLEFLNKEYSGELASGQMYNVNQRSGFLLDSRTGQALRYNDGHLAIVAENHLWAFMALLFNKDKIIDIIQNTTGIISLGNGDNILNYPREGMLGEIEYARRMHGRAVVSVALAALSAGDRKGGFAAKVIYRNSLTNDEFHQIELREISEFPTRGTSGFSAIDISGEESSEFYKLAKNNKWFIEDIFKNEDGTEKQVAFNVAFYAVDLRLIISRIFGLNENDRDLARRLKEIDDQEWSDKITEIGEAVPAIAHVAKGAPNENGTEEVSGYMTEQMVQDFIVNSLALLETPDGLPQPEVVIRLSERKDFFLPYKGKNQHELDESGNPVTDPNTGKPIENYDLIANQKRYAGVIQDHLGNGHQLVLGPNEYVTQVIPIDLEMVKKANKDIITRDKVLFERKNNKETIS